MSRKRNSLLGAAIGHERKTGLGRLGAFSDAVIAVIITVMVLELKAPDAPTLASLAPLWPTAISYAVSYLFIAIIWVNHDHLLRFVEQATPRLVWINFAHLFAVSLLPFATAWVARSRLAPVPVAIYAALFFFVNLAYRVFEHEVHAQADLAELGALARRMARRRSLATLLVFGAGAMASFFLPYLGFGLVCAALLFYLRPEAPGSVAQPKPSQPLPTKSTYGGRGGHALLIQH